MMNVYQSQAKTKSFNNTDMPAKTMLTIVSITFFLQGIIHNKTFKFATCLHVQKIWFCFSATAKCEILKLVEIEC